MRPGKRQALPEKADGKLLDWIEAAQAHRRAKVEHPFRVIKQQFGFQKTRFRGLPYRGHRPSVAEPLKPLQAQLQRSPHEPIYGSTSAAYSDINGGMVRA